MPVQVHSEPFLHPHIFTAWAGDAENLGIAAAAWIAADYLLRYEPHVK
ncbi:MAG: hypothetical protein WAL67_07525 [Candidatus Cybelea sp.]